MISLTPKGLAELERGRQKAGAALAGRLERLSARDLAKLEAAVTVIQSMLTEA